MSNTENNANLPVPQVQASAGEYVSLFSTPILVRSSNVLPGELVDATKYVLGLRTLNPGLSVSNRGGWHSTTDLFGPDFQHFSGILDAIRSAVRDYVTQSFTYKEWVRPQFRGWAVVNRPGSDFNIPHSHQQVLSGVLYISIPSEMRGGELMFQDPRLNLNASRTPEMDRAEMRPLWGRNLFVLRPETGMIVIFPSWLVHWVCPFECEAADCLRVSLSFNVSM